MTPDQLKSAFGLLVDEVCKSAVKMRVVGKFISTEEWLTLDARWTLLRQMNLVACYRRETDEQISATGNTNPAER